MINEVNPVTKTNLIATLYEKVGLLTIGYSFS